MGRVMGVQSVYGEENEVKDYTDHEGLGVEGSALSDRRERASTWMSYPA